MIASCMRLLLVVLAVRMRQECILSLHVLYLEIASVQFR